MKGETIRRTTIYQLTMLDSLHTGGIAKGTLLG